MHNRNEQPARSEGEPKPAGTGNASNPSPTNVQQENSSQLLDEKAEKYLREVASIEDVPDAQDQQDMDDTLKKENEG